MNSGHLFASAITTDPSLEKAISSLVEQVKAQLEGCKPDLSLVFITSDFTYQARYITQGLLAELDPAVLLGCTAEGIIGSQQEIEEGSAIALLAAHLPHVSISPFILQPTSWPAMLLNSEEFRRAVAVPDESRLVITLADPFSTPMDDVLQAFNTFNPGLPLVGGMASGALRPNGNVLLVNEHVIHSGLIGVALSGAFDVDVIVSQGCRPIWKPFKVQSAQKNVIFNLEGQPPLAWIQDLVPELSEEDRALLQKGLFIGRAIHPHQEVLGRGGFLIRGVIGVDQQNGAIAIGDSIMEGETVQFHLRDAATAQEDLEMMLIPQAFRRPPDSALLFSCNGRGTRLYDHPDGDISVIRNSLGEIPLAGFFCAGEVGPVGGLNFLHGHTACLVLLRSPAVEQ